MTQRWKRLRQAQIDNLTADEFQAYDNNIRKVEKLARKIADLNQHEIIKLIDEELKALETKNQSQ